MAAQQQPRGILKNKHEGGQRPHLTWDEETIAEHDKERGTRMKIDEPDTPYARYDPAEDPDVVQGASPLSPPKELQPVRSTSLDDHLGDLSEKLARAATDSEKPRAALFVEEEERDEAKARAFAAKRQQHSTWPALGRNGTRKMKWRRHLYCVFIDLPFLTRLRSSGSRRGPPQYHPVVRASQSDREEARRPSSYFRPSHGTGTCQIFST